jgi:subtilisin family serine protease
VGPDLYWIQFADKKGTSYSPEKPEEFLSQRALTRRSKQHIASTDDDLPVNQVYLDALTAKGLQIRTVSKWLNGAVVFTQNESLIDSANNLPFVIPSELNTQLLQKRAAINKFCLEDYSSVDYGRSKNQISMLHGDFLHSKGLYGANMLIAILDAGFMDYLVADAFDSIRDRQQIIATRDFVNSTSGMDAHLHGSLILSIIAGIIPGQSHGIATEAEFVLIRTENAPSENLVEEYYWAAGAEYADSIGADIIQSSLGYSEFDDPAQNHTYADMNGRTCPVSIAAAAAARKGILVVSSAGNEGGYAWQKITAPADADSILAVGAVDSLRKIAWFSSRGPSADKRVKPDVCARGVNNAADQFVNETQECTGTSCSAPVITGLSACLWGAFPDASAQEIREAIIKSASGYSNPDTAYGYGLPDFFTAYLYLTQSSEDTTHIVSLRVFPNPAEEAFYISANLRQVNNRNGEIRISSLNGSLLGIVNEQFDEGLNIKKVTAFSYLEKGYYILQLSIDGRSYEMPFIKL